MFIGTGEHIHDLERFEPRPFIQKLLGMGDLTGLMEKATEIQGGAEKQEAMRKKLAEGQFTLRDMRDQFINFSKMCVSPFTIWCVNRADEGAGGRCRISLRCFRAVWARC